MVGYDDSKQSLNEIAKQFKAANQLKIAELRMTATITMENNSINIPLYDSLKNQLEKIDSIERSIL